MSHAPHILVIDNYDSFTYNLVQALAVIGAQVEVHRNDALTVAQCLATGPSHVLISPGPGRPEDAGISMAVIEAFMGRGTPLLGVCLGHQAIAQVLGGTVRAARALVHGKASPVHHDGRGLFQGLPNPMACGRYHSLAVTRLPAVLRATAHTEDGELMAFEHRDLPVWGVQFHPESILTPTGPELLRNFLLPAHTPERRP